MGSQLIYWTTFSWEAFAGLAAVIAAWRIGLKQAEIQKDQAELQSLALRTELFDRRYKIYEQAKKYLDELMRLGRPPSDLSFEMLSRAVNEAKFLFNQNTVEQLVELRSRAVEFMRLATNMKDSRNKFGTYGDGQPKQKHDSIKWFLTRLETLTELFEEMKLSKSL